MSRDPESILQSVKISMTKYYMLLCSMPHMHPDNLQTPPPEGWSDTNIESWKARGKSNSAITFLRHLPFLAPAASNTQTAQNVWITPFTIATPFITTHRSSSSSSQPDLPDPDLPLPPHVIPIGLSSPTASRSLLLDTDHGTITELATDGMSQTLPRAEYDALPAERKWTAHRTLPAQEFFSREEKRLRRLVYVPVPSGGEEGELRFYLRARTAAEEEGLMAVEDEDDAEQDDDDDDGDYEDEEGNGAELAGLTLEGGSDEDDVEGEEDMEISDGEIEGLRADAERELDSPAAAAAAAAAAAQGAPSLTAWKPESVPEDVMRAYTIYKQNKWPHPDFDVEKCQRQLLEFQAQHDIEEVEKSKSAAQRMREDYFKRLTPEQLRQIEEKKRLAEDRKREK